MNIKLEELIRLKACFNGLNRFKSLNLDVATLEQTLSVCTVSDVLWYLGKDQSNLSNIVVFAQWCAEEANKYAAATYAAECASHAITAADAAAHAIIAAEDAADTAYAAAYAVSGATKAAAEAVREEQKAKLLELFS
jgi:hypothetical protein